MITPADRLRITRYHQELKTFRHRAHARQQRQDIHDAASKYLDQITEGPTVRADERKQEARTPFLDTKIIIIGVLLLVIASLGLGRASSSRDQQQLDNILRVEQAMRDQLTSALNSERDHSRRIADALEAERQRHAADVQAAAAMQVPAAAPAAQVSEVK